MKVRAQPRLQTIAQARAELSRRLETRRDEIEAAVTTRVYSVSDTTDLDPTYAEGLKAAVTAAVDYGLIAIELGEDRCEPPPPILLAQARMAARAGVSLDTVLRRYFAGHALLADYLVEEAGRGGLNGSALRRLLRTQAALFDRLLEAVSEEHAREAKGRPGSSEQRLAERMERLLAGELIDTSGVAYDFYGWHLGAIVAGGEAEEALRELAASLDRCLLKVHREEETVWAWLGGRRPSEPDELERALSRSLPAGLSLALGEPGQGLPGWRLTHHQARAALPIALRHHEPVVRYADVALLVSILNDDLLASSLRQLYLEPLELERDGGEAARETLRAYFTSNCHVSSTAAALRTSRPTVTKRLNAVEARVGRPLNMCRIELEAALRLDAFAHR